MLIPSDYLPVDTKIMLDLMINKSRITIIRTRQDSEKPIIIKDKKETIFENLNDARDYLNHLLYLGKDQFDHDKNPSFRQLISPLIRDEDSEFRDILNSHNVKKKIPQPDLAKIHLYFFNIDFRLVDEIQKIFKEIDKISTVERKLLDELTNLNTRKLSDVKAELNSLNKEVEKIDNAIDSFKSNEAYETHQNDLLTIQEELDTLRTKQNAFKYEIRRINSLPQIDHIDMSEIEITYNQFKSGLGDTVKKSIEEVQEFKKKIDEFQNKLMSEKLETLKKELEKVTNKIRSLEELKKSKMELIDGKGVLKDIKNSVSVFNQKSTSLHSLKTKLNDYETYDRELNKLNLKKDELFIKLDMAILEEKDVIENFNKTIINIHEYIMGNNIASFDIKTKRTKQIVEFEYRIHDDGSYSVDRTKVFIYDLALMFNNHTRERHPKFLIHDNIFNVDQDTLIQSLNFLAEQEEKYTDFQYILTLNRDKIENEERKKEIKLTINEHTRATFTKQKKFLKLDYQEI